MSVAAMTMDDQRPCMNSYDKMPPTKYEQNLNILNSSQNSGATGGPASPTPSGLEDHHHHHHPHPHHHHHKQQQQQLKMGHQSMPSPETMSFGSSSSSKQQQQQRKQQQQQHSSSSNITLMFASMAAAATSNATAAEWTFQR